MYIISYITYRVIYISSCIISYHIIIYHIVMYHIIYPLILLAANSGCIFVRISCTVYLIQTLQFVCPLPNKTAVKLTTLQSHTRLQICLCTKAPRPLTYRNRGAAAQHVLNMDTRYKRIVILMLRPFCPRDKA